VRDRGADGGFELADLACVPDAVAADGDAGVAGCAAGHRGGPGAERAGVEGGEQFLPGGLGGGVVADPVEQVTGQLLGSGADGAAAAASDERSPAG